MQFSIILTFLKSFRPYNKFSYLPPSLTFKPNQENNMLRLKYSLSHRWANWVYNFFLLKVGNKKEKKELWFYYRETNELPEQEPNDEPKDVPKPDY